MKPEYGTTIVINSLNYPKSSYDNFVTILKKSIYTLCLISYITSIFMLILIFYLLEYNVYKYYITTLRGIHLDNVKDLRIGYDFSCFK
jgi:hypothetical protein